MNKQDMLMVDILSKRILTRYNLIRQWKEKDLELSKRLEVVNQKDYRRFIELREGI